MFSYAEVPEVAEPKSIEGSVNRGQITKKSKMVGKHIYVVLPNFAIQKKLFLIKAWEESEKSKRENQ